MNYKSVVGADSVYYALVTQDDAAAYVAAAPAYLAPVMAITVEPSVNTKTQYADNQPFNVDTSEGETKVGVEITGLPLDVLAILLGKVYDAATGRMFDNGGVAPYVALGWRALKSDGKYRHYWYLKGTFAPPKEDLATKSDTPDPKSTKLDFTGIRTVHQFAVTGGLTDSVKKVVGDTADSNFVATTWFDAVQVPSVGAPAALTCTFDPVDGAAGVAVTKAPTLTFNNAIVTETAGIVLTTAAGVIKACTITINAAKKIITVTPTSNLAGGTTWLLTVTGVKDVFGQTLANTVVDFATV
jgi:phi13 family phage major tail protein